MAAKKAAKKKPRFYFQLQVKRGPRTQWEPRQNYGAGNKALALSDAKRYERIYPHARVVEFPDGFDVIQVP